MTLEEHIALCEQHRKQLCFNKFDYLDAWQLGQALYQNAQDLGYHLAIEICLNQTVIFSALMPGATAENVDWVRRKRNTVAFLSISSWAAGLMLNARQTTLEERYGLDMRDYAAFGGAYPLIVTGCGMTGTVTVSGAPQLDDHNLVITTLAHCTGVNGADFSRVPEFN